MEFSFDVKYLPGAWTPSGTLAFEILPDDLIFNSLVFDWLVVDGDKATAKGLGTINGEGPYDFVLTVYDNPEKRGRDRFRLLIWNESGVVYDNQMGDLITADPIYDIGKGSIQILK
jgi:hypothetical protein